MENSALASVWAWLRAYQIAFILDTSRYIIFNKSRRVGISDAVALKIVLISSGLFADVFAPALGIDPILTHNVNVISKDEIAAKEVIKYAKKWVQILRTIPEFRPWLETGDEWSKSAIDFARSGFEIRAHTQSENAARSATGHLVLDEAAHYREHEGIERGAVPSINSTPELTLTRISTPNGTTGRGELFYRICEFPEDWPLYSRHRVTIQDAVAQGMPVDVEEVRGQCATDEVFEQEYCCVFTGAGGSYYSPALLNESRTPRPPEDAELVTMGIDVASVVDLTAVTVWRRWRAMYLCERYLVEGVPYASRPGVIGQDQILAALIKYHRPAFTKIDATGDTSTILSSLSTQRLPTRLIPHHIKREWKVGAVPALRGAFERGEAVIDASARTYRFDAARANRDGLVSVEEHFGALRRDPLVRDFEKVHKKLTPGGATTFDTKRDAAGHGDLFWSSLLGWDAAPNRRVREAAVSYTAAPQADGGW